MASANIAKAKSRSRTVNWCAPGPKSGSTGSWPDGAGRLPCRPSQARRPSPGRTTTSPFLSAGSLDVELGSAVELTCPRVGRHRRQSDGAADAAGDSRVEQCDRAEDVRLPDGSSAWSPSCHMRSGRVRRHHRRASGFRPTRGRRNGRCSPGSGSGPDDGPRIRPIRRPATRTDPR